MFDCYSSSCEVLHFSLYYSLCYNDREVCGNLDERINYYNWQRNETPLFIQRSDIAK